MAQDVYRETLRDECRGRYTSMAFPSPIWLGEFNAEKVSAFRYKGAAREAFS